MKKHALIIAATISSGVFFNPLLAINSYAEVDGPEVEEGDIHGEIPEPVDISDKAVLKILRKGGYSKVKLIEVDYEIHEGKKVYEADFKYKGKEYEAIISLSRKLLHVEADVDD